MSEGKQLNIRLHNCKNEVKSIDQQIVALRQRRKKLKDEIDLIEKQLNSSSGDRNQDQFLASYPWSDQAQQLLKSVFKLQSFRSHQLSAINATLSGYDVLLIMPTGGGKSLCFQLTALISKGLTVVVSPLISLMEDQLNSLNQLGIPTAILNSNTSKEDSQQIMKSIAAEETHYRLLYVTPEKLAKSKRIMAQLEKCYQNKQFKRLVIDEVHCCSQWGHDFRTDYQFLGIMRNQFPETPILGLTATATPIVVTDIQKILNIQGCYVFKDSFFRSNLNYSISRVDDLKKEELLKKLAKMLKDRFAQQSGLIYCLTVKEVEEVAQSLSSLGIKATPYHAQLTPGQRSKAYNRWFRNEAQVIVATVAFGMGINKEDVRFVIHYTMSKSFENYYQETGRAGRDGKSAECILFFKFADVFRATTMVFSEKNGLSNVYAMLSYCLNRSLCRKEQIAYYFGDDWKNSCDNHCDNCTMLHWHKTTDIKQNMVTISKILVHASQQNKRLTALKLVDIWLGKGEKKLRPDNVTVPKYSRDTACDIIGFLLTNNYLKEEFHFTPYSTISYINVGSAWITNPSSQINYSMCSSTKQLDEEKVEEKTKRKKLSIDNFDVITLD